MIGSRGAQQGAPDMPPALAAQFATRATRQRLGADATLARAGEPMRDVVLVQSGLVRCVSLGEEGRRHIFRFASAGAVLCVLPEDGAAWEIETVCESWLRTLPRPAFEDAVRSDPAAAAWRVAHLGEVAQERRRLLLSIASLAAEARLKSFLVDFARRAGTDLARAGGMTALPMGRRDIADHLGLSIETVSRAFTALRRRGELLTAGPGVYRVTPAGQPIFAA